MRTIALFGATGKTGVPFVKKATGKYKIKALVRNPRKIDSQYANFEIIHGDMLNAEAVEKCIAGCDLVVSLIGHKKNSPATLQTDATKLILDSMKRNKVKRLISLTGGGVHNHETDKPKFMDRFIVIAMKNLAGKLARNALLDGINHAEIIKNSKTDWTIVRGPMLTNGPAKGKTEVDNVGEISGFKLTREDLVQFILNELEENKYIHKMPFLSNGK